MKALLNKVEQESQLLNDIDKAVKGVDFVHTDVWVSMGEPLETWGESYPIIIALPSDSRVNETHW